MINIVVALLCEAKPLIDYYNLKSFNFKTPFPIYGNDRIKLIISGIGKFASAVSTSYLFSSSEVKEKVSIWLNVGVAGHKSMEIGQGILAHKVVDVASSRAWYPSLLFKKSWDTAIVQTYDEVVKDYPEGVLVEMEASGFCAAASYFSMSEFIHCYKVISDNALKSSKQINKGIVEELIHCHIENVVEIIESLLDLTVQLEDLQKVPQRFEEILSRWHFTLSEKYRLQKVLRALEMCDLQSLSFDEEIKKYSKGRDVLKFLEKKLDLQAITFA